MPKTVLVHIANEDPILAEMEELPNPSDSFITITNPRRKDGKPVPYLAGGVRSVMFPWWRISFLEVMVSEAEQHDIIGFYREGK
jgi:hypothetical protein